MVRVFGLLAVIFMALPAAAQVSENELARAWQLGEELKVIQDQSAALQEQRKADETAARAPAGEFKAQIRLLNTELRTIRNIYRSDRPALAVIDGKATGPSNADPADVRRAAAIRSEVERLTAAQKAADANYQSVRQQYATELARLSQAKTQTDLAIRRLQAPHQGDREALAAIEERLLNAQGRQTTEQVRAARAAEQAAAKAEREAAAQAKRDGPALEVLENAKTTASNQIQSVGDFQPDNEFEEDILAAALLHWEAKALESSRQANHELVQTRLREINGDMATLNAKHAATAEKDHPFRTQWMALSRSELPEDKDSLIKPIQKLLAPVYAATKASERAASRTAFWSGVGNWISFLFWIAIIGGLIYLFIQYRKTKKGRDKRAMERSNLIALQAFGADEAERARRIDEVFNRRSESINFDTNHRRADSSQHYMRFEMLRSLAAMPAREREALRVAYHLYNIGELAWNNFYWIRLALIFGDGKGQIVGDYQMTGYGDSAAGAIRSYLDPVTAESAVTLALNHLEKVSQRKPDHPVIRALTGRLMTGGGDGGLSSSAEFRAAQSSSNRPGVVLGDAEDTGETLKHDGEGSLITVAPPGSGKTQCHVFPTLLTWPGPAVVLDVKGEIYAGTSKWRAENVGPVYKFSPLEPATSHCYNPLTAVRSDPEFLWEDARFLADMMLVPTGAKDPFWENRARDVLTAAIAKVCLEEDADKRPMSDVLDVFHGVGWDKFVRALQARVDIRSMSRAGNSLGEMDPKTRDGVLQTGLSSLSAWDGDRIARATKRSDWSPLDLRSGKNPTVYICLKPNEVESYISLLRVFIAQHIRMLTTELPPRDQLPILFVLDELPRLRQMPPVEEALEIGRQYGIKLWMFTQSIGQLQNAYPNADGMIGSCAVRMYMNPSLHDGTAQKISDDIGMQESVLDGTRQKLVESNTLAGPDYKDFVIVMIAGMKPMRVRKHFAYQDETIRVRMGSL